MHPPSSVLERQIPTLVINSAHNPMHQSWNYSYFLSHLVTKRQYHQQWYTLFRHQPTHGSVPVLMRTLMIMLTLSWGCCVLSGPSCFPRPDVTSILMMSLPSPGRDLSDQSEDRTLSDWPIRCRVPGSVRHSSGQGITTLDLSSTNTEQTNPSRI